MNNSSLRFLLIFLIVLLVWLPFPSQAQLIMGQYEDEAPFRTWNTFGLMTSASLSTGGAHYAHAFDLSSALTNPSQLSRLPKVMVIFNGSLNRATLFKYSIVNTGPTYTEENSSLVLYSLDFGGVSINLNGWGFALSSSILENYDRPSAFFEYEESGFVLYRLDFEQTGLLRNINFAVSKNLGKQFSLGLGFNLVTGSLTKNLAEEYYRGSIIITDDKSHKLRGFYINGGFTVQVSERLQAAAVFRTPYKKTSDSESLLQYEVPQTGTDITIKSQDESYFHQPLLLGIGVNYWFTNKFRAAADWTYFNWSQYKVTFFGEERPREFKDIVSFRTGLEYMSKTKLFGLLFDVPLWVGFHYDPQPMRNPNSSYLYATFGTGLVLDRFFLHAGASLGYENGSGDHLRGRRVVLTVGYRIEQ